MSLEQSHDKIKFMESETLHRKKLHEEEISKFRRSNDELYEK
jgi:hypothetical protein